MTIKSVVLHGQKTQLFAAVRERLTNEGYVVHHAQSKGELDKLTSAPILLGVGVDVEQLPSTGQLLCSIAPSRTAKVYQFERLVQTRGRKCRRRAFFKLDRLVAHIAEVRRLQLLV